MSTDCTRLMLVNYCLLHLSFSLCFNRLWFPFHSCVCLPDKSEWPNHCHTSKCCNVQAFATNILLLLSFHRISCIIIMVVVAESKAFADINISIHPIFPMTSSIPGKGSSSHSCRASDHNHVLCRRRRRR